MGNGKSAKSLRDVSRKSAVYREHMKNVPYSVSPAQALMREEMERGVHKPQLLSAVLEEEFGSSIQDTDVLRESALSIIHEHGAGLSLGIKEWEIITLLVEEGLAQGFTKGAQSVADALS